MLPHILGNLVERTVLAGWTSPELPTRRSCQSSNWSCAMFRSGRLYRVSAPSSRWKVGAMPARGASPGHSRRKPVQKFCVACICQSAPSAKTCSYSCSTMRRISPLMARSSSSAPSWYRQATAEFVLGQCTYEQHCHFLETCPLAEKYLIDAGIRLIKLWVEMGPESQERRLGRPPGRSDAAMEGRGSGPRALQAPL